MDPSETAWGASVRFTEQPRFRDDFAQARETVTRRLHSVFFLLACLASGAGSNGVWLLLRLACCGNSYNIV